MANRKATLVRLNTRNEKIHLEHGLKSACKMLALFYRWLCTSFSLGLQVFSNHLFIKDTVWRRWVFPFDLLADILEPIKTDLPSFKMVTQAFRVILANNTVACFLYWDWRHPRLMDVLSWHGSQLWHIFPEITFYKHLLTQFIMKWVLLSADA